MCKKHNIEDYLILTVVNFIIWKIEEDKNSGKIIDELSLMNLLVDATRAMP